MIQAVLLVGLGGAAGSILRFLTALVVARVYKGDWPWATLAVNVVGSAAIGAIMAYFIRPMGQQGDMWKLLVVTGVLGGFTTFSAFSLETIELIHRAKFGMAIGYVLASNIAGLIAAFAAYRIFERAA